jgi:hypothetical protein
MSRWRSHPRALNQLKQFKVLSNHGDEGYRLSTRLSQFIDGALNSDRMRRLDTDLGGWIDLLEQQIILYQDAYAEDRLVDVANTRCRPAGHFYWYRE